MRNRSSLLRDYAKALRELFFVMMLSSLFRGRRRRIVGGVPIPVIIPFPRGRHRGFGGVGARGSW